MPKKILIIDDEPEICKMITEFLFDAGYSASYALNGPDGLAMVVVRVQDTGPGMTEDVRRRVFEPFFSTKPHGTGMGLAICRSIIEVHDGKLWAENSPRGGAILKFTVRAQS